jgi:AraC family transcriptional regulator of adaptative response / DNA-3-methyladenine glycosylase II
MRALSDPDVFLPGDVGVVRALQHRTAANGSGPGKAASGSLAAAERWRPWRSYATHHLWAALESAPAHVDGVRAEASTARA